MDYTMKSGMAAEVLLAIIDDEYFRLDNEASFILARNVSPGILWHLSAFFSRAIILCIMYMLVVCGLWLYDIYYPDSRSGSFSILALWALGIGILASVSLFALAFALHRIDHSRRKATASNFVWKFDVSVGWFYNSYGAPLVSAREADIEFSSELIGRELYLYQFHLKKNDEKILLLESAKFKPTLKFINLLIEWGFPRAGNWEKQLRRLERVTD